MTRAALLVFAACWSHSDPPPPAAAKPAPPPELRCKIAVERAAEKVDLRPKDVTMAIGECEQQDWTQPGRACVAAVHDEDDLVACGKKYVLGTHGIFQSNATMREAMLAMEKFRDQMCACSDQACAQQVSEGMTKWSQEIAANWHGEFPRPTEEDTRRMAEITRRMTDCMTRAMSASPPATP